MGEYREADKKEGDLAEKLLVENVKYTPKKRGFI